MRVRAACVPRGCMHGASSPPPARPRTGIADENKTINNKYQVLVGCGMVAVVLTLVSFVFIKLTGGLTLSVINVAKQLVRGVILCFSLSLSLSCCCFV